MKRVQSFLAGMDIFLLCMFAGYMAEHGIMDFTKQEFAAKVQTQTVAGRAVKDETEKKVALTFDDDVIIGLSQEISYKEAVSMI